MIFGGFPAEIDAFIILWIIFWLIAVFSISYIIWKGFSKEIITVSSEVIEIGKSALKLKRVKRYAISNVKNLRAIKENEPPTFDAYQYWGRMGFRFVGMEYKLSFDYGMKTVRFASSIDSPEAEYILSILKQRGGLNG